MNTPLSLVDAALIIKLMDDVMKNLDKDKTQGGVAPDTITGPTQGAKNIVLQLLRLHNQGKIDLRADNDIGNLINKAEEGMIFRIPPRNTNSKLDEILLQQDIDEGCIGISTRY